jgi:DNA-directed RNA polymerase subunit N
MQDITSNVRRDNDDNMIIPIRCQSCGKVVAHLWETFQKRIQAGEDPKKVLDELGLKRYCCRSLFLTHADTYKQVAKYKR